MEIGTMRRVVECGAVQSVLVIEEPPVVPGDNTQYMVRFFASDIGHTITAARGGLRTWASLARCVATIRGIGYAGDITLIGSV